MTAADIFLSKASFCIALQEYYSHMAASYSQRETSSPISDKIGRIQGGMATDQAPFQVGEWQADGDQSSYAKVSSQLGVGAQI